ncbi:hypothetical protein Tco_1182317 [Tanacetum coccineum]
MAIGTGHRSNNYSESKRNDHLDNNRCQEQRNKESVKTSKALKEIFLEFKDVSHDFIPDERCVWIDLVGLPLASWALEVYKKFCVRGKKKAAVYDKGQSESNPRERKSRGSYLDEGLKIEAFGHMSNCEFRSPKNVNNESVSPSSSGFARGGCSWGGKVIL